MGKSTSWSSRKAKDEKAIAARLARQIDHRTHLDGVTVSAASYVYPQSECAQHLDLPLQNVHSSRAHRTDCDKYMFVYHQLLNALPLHVLCNEWKIKILPVETREMNGFFQTGCKFPALWILCDKYSILRFSKHRI
jgi:hypothetical protein